MTDGSTHCAYLPDIGPDCPAFEPALILIAASPSSNPGSSASPIFIHSSFRTSSTWLWNKLRQAPTTTAYFEIFHESFATLNVDVIRASNHAGWRSKHPVSAPYFLEYLPLLCTSGGVENYDISMATESFIPADGIDGHLGLNERAYLASLIRHADDQHCIPVLTCTRSLGRTKAIRKAFPGTSIFLHRNLFHQWASYSSQAASGNPYFLKTISRTVANSRHDPTMRMLHDWFGDRESVDDMQSFQLFLLLHLYLYAHAYDSADMLVDVTAIADDATRRHATEGELSHLVSHHIDLSDVRADFGQSNFSVPDVTEFLDTIEQFTKMICGSGVSENSIAFVKQMKHQALAEWRRHDFYTREFRETTAAQISAMRTSQQENESALAAMRAGRDEDRAKLAEAAAERDALRQAVMAITAQCDECAARLAEPAANCDGL